MLVLTVLVASFPDAGRSVDRDDFTARDGVLTASRRTVMIVVVASDGQGKSVFGPGVRPILPPRGAQLELASVVRRVLGAGGLGSARASRVARRSLVGEIELRI